MKIGYLIMCHKEPQIVGEIVHQLIDGTSNVAVIHVDAKADMDVFKELIVENEQIVFINNRIRNYWGV